MFYNSEKKSKQRVLLRTENRIIVRIWTSASNKEVPGESVGHVSIETNSPKGYMSLWPKGSDKEQATDRGFFSPVTADFKKKPDDDLIAEDRNAELTICLYGLNSDHLHEEWESVKTTLKGWTLIGGNRLFNNGEGESCASLAYRLLCKGGLYELISHTQSSRFSSVVSPDQLAIAVAHAKRAELETHPETADFIYAEETPLIQLPGKSSTCLIL